MRHPLVKESALSTALKNLPFCTGTLCPASADYDKANDSLGVVYIGLYPYFLLEYIGRFVQTYLENIGSEIQRASSDLTGALQTAFEPLGSVSVTVYLFAGGVAASGGVWVATAGAGVLAGSSAFLLSAFSIVLIYFFGDDVRDHVSDDSPFAPYADEIIALTEDGLALSGLWI